MTNMWPDHYRFVDEIGPEGVTIHCHRYVVVGETPRCYYVLRDGCAHYAQQDSEWALSMVKRFRRRVLKDSWKRFCYPDLKDAMRSYRARKSWQIKHAKLAMSRAEAGYAEAERLCMSGVMVVESFPHQCVGGEYIKGLNWSDC